jgi:penicillin-binding protein 2
MLDSPNERILVFRVLFAAVCVLFTIRLFSMQILSGDVYRSRAQDISRRTYSIPTQRGEIFDRNFDSPFVVNRDSYAVAITPAEVPRNRMEEVLETVAKIIGQSTDDIKDKLPSQYIQLYQPVEIASNVSFSTIAALAERKDIIPGISWHIKSIRNYNDVGSLSHIIGYVGDITRDELTTLYNMGYQSGDVIGKAGIERQYDQLLRGKDGWETRTVDVRGRRIAGRENIVVPPEIGKNLILTIDKDLQTLVEKALGQRIGTAVVVRPSTGEILAMVSYPWYDSNIFTEEGLQSNYRALVEDTRRPFLNRAIQANYPPASTFKIIMTTSIISSQVFSTEQRIICRGVVNFGGRDWNCHVRYGHGSLNLKGALAQSCNIYYMTVGRENVGADRIAAFAKEYGYGEITGIDLPGEIAGVIPTSQWKERQFHERWVAGDTMNMSIGQGYTLVTPLQMANMVSMIVNDGKIYKPHVLKEVRDPATGAIEQVVTPELLHESKNITPQVFEAVRQDMRGVITSGTAQYPLNNIRSVQIAGKTGTAEVGLQDRWHSWFTAYGPYNATNTENTIALSIIVEAANPWEWWAPYASAIIFQGYFANQTYEEAVRTMGFQYLMPVQGRRE